MKRTARKKALAGRTAAIVAVTFAGATVLSSCGPVPERLAYERCSERARLAERPRGTIGVGVGTGGVSTDFSLTVSSDYIAGRDPQAVYESCFRQLTGAGPTRPLRL